MLFRSPDGNAGFHPPTAQHALRQGRCAARNVAAEVLGGRKKPLRFMTLGRLAVIGNRTGVANVFGLNFSGFLAWWLWRTIYLLKLPRLEKKVRVALDWTLDLCFAKDFTCLTAGMPLSGEKISAITFEATTRSAESAVSDSIASPAPTKPASLP